jgi:hypothetical protein
MFRRRELKVSFRTAEPWERPTDWKRNEMPVAAAGVAEVGRISIPQLVREAKRLRLFCPFWRRRRPKGGQRSLREISAELARRGITNERGKPSLERRLTRCSTELRSRLSVAGVTYVTTNAPNFAVSFRDLFWAGRNPK